jgi:hypothetical protein
VKKPGNLPGSWQRLSACAERLARIYCAFGTSDIRQAESPAVRQRLGVDRASVRVVVSSITAMSEQYFVVLEGQQEARGPFNVEELQVQAGAGSLGHGARINKVGSDTWEPLASVVQLPGKQQSSTRTVQRSVRHPLAWAVYAALVFIAALLVEGVLLARWLRTEAAAHADSIRASQKDLLDAATAAAAAARSAERPSIVKYESLKNNCRANNNLATCHLTNFADDPVAVCFQGLIVQKGAAGVRLYSLPVCSGPIGPRSTREVAAPWDGGNADDLCKNERGFLDWSQCEFTVIDFDPAAKK